MSKHKIGNVYPPDAYLMARCAPAGFGLGGNGKRVEISSISELDSLSNNGWYGIHSSNELTLGGFSFTDCVLETCSLSEAYGWQVVRFLGKNSILIRHKNNGVWEEWEWDNPPMELGKEYRTTERWNGKPVYTCLANAGPFPETGMRDGETNIVATGVIRFHASIGYTSLPVPGSMELYTSHNGEKIVLRMHTIGERVYNTDVYVTLYYIKN